MKTVNHQNKGYRYAEGGPVQSPSIRKGRKDFYRIDKDDNAVELVRRDPSTTQVNRSLLDVGVPMSALGSNRKYRKDGE